MEWGIILLSVFMVVMVGIGIWGLRKSKSVDDFFLGGRTIGPWVSALAYGTTYFSAVLFIGFAGKQGWAFGFDSLWIAAGNALIGALAAWLVLGRRTRIMSHNLGAMTMPEFFAERYGSRNLKLYAALLIFVFLLPYSASVFQGLGYLFEANFGIPYEYALLIMIGITGVYLVLGGYFAVTLNDFVQGLVMLVGCFLMVGIFVGKGGGFGKLVGDAAAAFQAHIPAAQRPDFLTIASLVFMTSFGAWGLPQMVQKFYAIKDETVIKKAAVATTIFAVVIVFSAYFVGSLSHLFFAPDTLPRLASGGPNFDAIIPAMLTGYLPDVLMALILLLVLSASMSTLSSLVLVSSSAVTIDFWKGRVRPGMSDKSSLRMLRALSIVFVAFSFLISLYKIDVIVTLMSLSWGVIAGSFIAAYVYGLYWKGANKVGAWAAMIAGGATAVALFFVLGKANSPLASSIAMIVPMVVLPVASRFGKAPAAEIVAKAFRGIGRKAG